MARRLSLQRAAGWFMKGGPPACEPCGDVHPAGELTQSPSLTTILHISDMLREGDTAICMYVCILNSPVTFVAFMNVGFPAGESCEFLRPARKLTHLSPSLTKLHILSGMLRNIIYQVSRTACPSRILDLFGCKCMLWRKNCLGKYFDQNIENF